MDQKRRAILNPRTGVLVMLGIATGAKALWAATSAGTSDSMLFFYFAKEMERRGMAWLYQASTVFNHTPLTGGFVHLLYDVTHGDYLHFAMLLRLASVLADIALVLGLLHVKKLTGKPPWWALALYAASPVSIMVSGFHGNIDPIMVMLLFFAGVAVVEDQPVLSGVMFAAASNVKIVPILVAPVFIFYWMGRGRRSATGFIVASGTLMLGGAAWGLVNCPGGFLRNLFGYGSYWGSWGVTYWLRETGISDFRLMSFEGLTPAQNHVITAMKVIMLVGLTVLAWRRRRLGGMEFFTTLGAAFTWIFVAMPGAGVQYMVWYAPFVLLMAPRWWAALTAASVVYMARFYDSTAQHHFPWDLALPHGPEAPYWAPWTNLVWGTFIVLLVCKARGWLLIESRGEKAAPGPVARQLAVELLDAA